MTILFSIQNIGIGGVQTFMLRLAKALAKKHKVIIFDHFSYLSKREYIQALPEEIIYESFAEEYKGIDKLLWKVNALGRVFFKNVTFWDWLNKKYFQSMIRKYSVDVVLTFDFKSDLKSVKYLSNVPIVLSMHGSYDIVDGRFLMPEVEHEKDVIFNKISGIAYICSKNIEILDCVRNGKKISSIEKIYYGFDVVPPFDITAIRKQLNLPVDAFIFGMVARGDETKGWREALCAFIEVNKKYPQSIFICIGESDFMNELKRLYGENKAVVFLGFIANPMEYVKAINVGLLPTYFATENLPNSVIEYLSCAKPVIATNYVEIPNMLEADNERAGILIDLNKNGKPEISSIEKAMLSYIESPELLAQHAALTSIAFQKFDMDNCSSKYEALLHQVVQEYSCA